MSEQMGEQEWVQLSVWAQYGAALVAVDLSKATGLARQQVVIASVVESGRGGSANVSCALPFATQDEAEAVAEMVWSGGVFFQSLMEYDYPPPFILDVSVDRVGGDVTPTPTPARTTAEQEGADAALHTVSPDENKGLSAVVAAGAGAAVGAFLLLAVLGGFFIHRRRRQRKVLDEAQGKQRSVAADPEAALLASPSKGES
jgi:MYXO-CTERM domain-containing protein